MSKNARKGESAQTSIKEFTDFQKMEERMTKSITDAILNSEKNMTEAIATTESTLKKSISELRAEVTKELQEMRDDIDDDINDLRKELENQIQAAKREQERHEYHDRKYNLIFSGLQTTTRGNETKTLEKIYDTLGLPVPKDITNFHLLNPSPHYPNESRMIVRYMRWDDRQQVFEHAKKLKDTKIRVQTDLPSRLRLKRNELLQIRKQLVAEGKQARVIEREQDVILQCRQSKNDKWEKYAKNV